MKVHDSITLLNILLLAFSKDACFIILGDQVFFQLSLTDERVVSLSSIINYDPYHNIAKIK